MSSSPAARLIALCADHRAQIVEAWDDALRRIEAFSDTPASETRDNVEQCLEAFTAVLEGDGEVRLQQFTASLAERRFRSGFDLHVPIAAASRFRVAVAEVLGASQLTADRDLADQIDALLDAFNRRFSAAFAARIVAAREERLRELFAGAPELFVRVSATGTVLDANAAFETLLSVERPDWKKRPLAELHPQLAPLAEIVAAVLTTHAPAEGTVRLELKGDGAVTIRQFEARVHASSVDGDTSAVVMLRDVTDERALRAQVIQSEKLASIGQVAASVAHELNNPLTWVVSNLELGLEEFDALPVDVRDDLDGEFRASLSEALVGARRMAGIVRDLRTFARNERDEATPFDLGETVELALKIAGPQVFSHVDVERAYGDVGPMHGYPGRISQVLVNLVVNAGQACAAAGHRGRLRLETRRHGDTVLVDVLDDGPGISAEIEQRLFEPFVTSKGVEGTGLGLWTSRSVIEGLGGTLEHTRTDGWTRFRLSFPRDAAPRAKLRPVRRAPALSRGTVLVVDDEPAVVRVLERRLDRSGVQVLTATDARQALATLETRDGEVAAVLCDLSMPGMDGLALARELSRRWPQLETRVLFMSGAPDVMGQLAEGQRCFEKPVRFEAVLEALRELGC